MPIIIIALLCLWTLSSFERNGSHLVLVHWDCCSICWNYAKFLLTARLSLLEYDLFCRFSTTRLLFQLFPTIMVYYYRKMRAKRRQYYLAAKRRKESKTWRLLVMLFVLSFICYFIHFLVKSKRIRICDGQLSVFTFCHRRHLVESGTNSCINWTCIRTYVK